MSGTHHLTLPEYLMIAHLTERSSGRLDTSWRCNASFLERAIAAGLGHLQRDADLLAVSGERALHFSAGVRIMLGLGVVAWHRQDTLSTGYLRDATQMIGSIKRGQNVRIRLPVNLLKEAGLLGELAREHISMVHQNERGPIGVRSVGLRLLLAFAMKGGESP